MAGLVVAVINLLRDSMQYICDCLPLGSEPRYEVTETDEKPVYIYNWNIENWELAGTKSKKELIETNDPFIVPLSLPKAVSFNWFNFIKNLKPPYSNLLIVISSDKTQYGFASMPKLFGGSKDLKTSLEKYLLD